MAFTIPGNNCFFKKKAVSNDRFLVINVFSIAIVGVAYNLEGFILFLMACLNFSLYHTYSIYSLEVLKDLFSNIEIVCLRVGVVATELSYNKSYI